MGKVRFSWDDRKAALNLSKHGVSFEDASTVFFDESAREFFDPDHSDDEDRFLMAGFDCRLRLLVVSYCYDKEEKQIRIISARKATTKEKGEFARGKP